MQFERLCWLQKQQLSSLDGTDLILTKFSTQPKTQFCEPVGHARFDNRPTLLATWLTTLDDERQRQLERKTAWSNFHYLSISRRAHCLQNFLSTLGPERRSSHDNPESQMQGILHTKSSVFFFHLPFTLFIYIFRSLNFESQEARTGSSYPRIGFRTE